MATAYDKNDIKIGNTGDLVISDGDLNLCTSADCFSQHIQMRVLTNTGEIPLHESIGSNLEELMGMPNTRTTSEVGYENITASIEYGGNLPSNEITIRGVPTANNEITYYIYADMIGTSDIERVFVDVPVIL